MKQVVWSVHQHCSVQQAQCQVPNRGFSILDLISSVSSLGTMKANVSRWASGCHLEMSIEASEIQRMRRVLKDPATDCAVSASQ